MASQVQYSDEAKRLLEQAVLGNDEDITKQLEDLDSTEQDQVREATWERKTSTHAPAFMPRQWAKGLLSGDHTWDWSAWLLLV